MIRIENSGFIELDGSTIPLIHGMTHDAFCKNIGTTLRKELKRGVIRVGGYNDCIALESLKRPNKDQIATIRKILHGSDCFSLVIHFSGKHDSITTDIKPIKIGAFKKLYDKLFN